MNTFELSGDEAERLLNQMIVFANGVAAFVINDRDSFSKEAVSRDLSQMCIGVVIVDKLQRGDLDMSAAKAMADACVRGVAPQKRRQSFGAAEECDEP